MRRERRSRRRRRRTILIVFCSSLVDFIIIYDDGRKPKRKTVSAGRETASVDQTREQSRPNRI